ncbi:MAG: hypothetical protein SFV54_22785 [Bryobacteraceae bacterium]|nr:hypothetical protein [Bryobacteraceae bacterium]
MKRGLLYLLCAAAPVAAQSLAVRSEFSRVDPFGETVPADRGSEPREILSPAVGRGGFASYRLVVEHPPDKDFTLHVAQNPDNTVKASLYREIYAKAGEAWMPDKLEPVPLPYTGKVVDSERPIPNQKVQTFWLDVLVPPDAAVGRFRLEVQLWTGDRWIIYPLEIRVQAHIYPADRPYRASLPAVGGQGSASAVNVFRSYLCAGAPPGNGAVSAGNGSGTVRGMIRRNALQDAALAAWLESERGGAAALRNTIALAAGVDTPERFCKEPKVALENEALLRVRDYLLTNRLRGANSITVTSK